MRHAVLLLSLLLLAGCASPLQQLKDKEPSSNDFNSALASEYLGYAESESEQGRQDVGNYYATKGLRALEGKPVLPDRIDDKLEPADQALLATTREKLVKLLTDDVEHVAPQKAARTQLLFDCWQHQMHTRQVAAPCADEYKSALSDLQEVGDAFVYGKDTTYVIDFDPHKLALDEQDLAIIKEVADRAAAAEGPYTVQVQVYMGFHAWQRRLSERRLEAVHKALVDAGIDPALIHVKKYGSPKAVILRGDNVNAPDAKKIDITIKMRNLHKG